jgi:acetylornithine/succinyldiaminopimelate/putrescine aminotransferase
MFGIELTADFAARAKLPDGKTPSLWMVERLHKAGLLAIPSGTHALRWLPPLNVQRSHLDEAVAILQATLNSIV